jgi:hypothetical protein
LDAYQTGLKWHQRVLPLRLKISGCRIENQDVDMAGEMVHYVKNMILNQPEQQCGQANTNHSLYFSFFKPMK